MKHFKNAIFALFAACLLTVVVGVAQAEDATAEADAFQRLAAKAISINDSGPIGPKTKNALGIGRDGEDFLIFQIKVDIGADLHYYNLAKDGSGRVVLVSRIGGVVYYFALDSQQRPTAAAVKSIESNGQIVTVTIDSVRPQLMKMMAFWIDWAAQNTGGK